MIFLSTVLACLLIGSGLSAVFIGSGMIVLERGWSMVISGSVVATGGVLLLGIAMLIRELRRLPDRLADVLPEALPSHLLYSADDFAEHPGEAADAHAARRPRIDPVVPAPPEPVAPAEPLNAEPRNAEPRNAEPSVAESLAAGPLPAGPLAAGPLPAEPSVEAPDAPQAPPPRKTDSDASSEDGVEAAGSSALRIQISLHGNGRQDAIRPEAEDRPAAIAPTTGDAGRSAGADAGKQPRSFWSRLGRGEKPAPEKAPEPVAEADAPAPPPGPTAAERARERLAMADTPESRIDEAAQALQTKDAAADARPADKAPTDDSPPDAGAADHSDAKGAASATADDGAPSGKGAAGTGESAAPRASADSERADDSGPDEPEAASAKPESDEATPPRPAGNGAPAIVGSYRAGGNLYVMFDDGAIEAETPHGIFRFASLDRLKAYIASGEDPALAGQRVDRPATDAQTAAASDVQRKAAS
ncbi:hypothetical protein ACUSIJ_13325 [Pseudochelatococcus sp. B33]